MNVSNLLQVYLALAEFGRQRAARRAAAGQSTQQTADVSVLAESTPAAGARFDSRRVARSRPTVVPGSASIAQ
jgi:hypothetical protein